MSSRAVINSESPSRAAARPKRTSCTTRIMPVLLRAHCGRRVDLYTLGRCVAPLVPGSASNEPQNSNTMNSNHRVNSGVGRSSSLAAGDKPALKLSALWRTFRTTDADRICGAWFAENNFGLDTPHRRGNVAHPGLRPRALLQRLVQDGIIALCCHRCLVLGADDGKLRDLRCAATETLTIGCYVDASAPRTASAAGTTTKSLPQNLLSTNRPNTGNRSLVFSGRSRNQGRPGKRRPQSHFKSDGYGMER